MSELGDFHFLEPAWLVLVPMAWGLVWLLGRHYRRQSMWGKICDDKFLAYLVGDHRQPQELRWLLRLLALVLSIAILAMAGPGWRDQSSPLLASTAARVLVLDLSRSMLVTDIKPDRMTLALTQAKAIVSGDFAGETGLVVYAGAAFVVSPLSRDSDTLLAFLDALSPATMPLDGSRLDLAITTAQALLTASIAQKGQILVITDGGGDIMLATQAAGAASQQGNRVSLLALGSEAGGPVPGAQGDLTRDSNGRVVLAKTRFAALQGVSENGNGRFMRLTVASSGREIAEFGSDSDDIGETLSSIDETLKTTANDGIWLVWLILPLSLFLFRKNAFWVVLVGIVLPSDHRLYAMDFESLWISREQQAYTAYQQGDFPKVVELSDNPLLKGAAHYRMDQFSQASEAFALPISAQAFYNQGNAFAGAQQFPQAMVAYQRALELEPGFKDAEFNRQLIAAYLSQQPEAQGGDEDSSGDEDADTGASEALNAGSRAGSSGESSENPGDSQQPSMGAGIESDSAQLDLSEEYDGIDAELEALLLGEFSGEALPEPEVIDRWIDSLPEASFDLFQRKFLRDYNRQRRQDR